MASYQIEQGWYVYYAKRCNQECRVPNYLGGQLIEDRRVFILEDLNAVGYPIRKNHLNKKEVKVCLSWLASFHAEFMHEKTDDLWKNGTYWHLSTRKDEYASMPPSKLKEKAAAIDERLNSCFFKTIVHGDSKVANFCFSEDGTKVSAVDFQYVGEGCGMKDVAYLFSSCLSSDECFQWDVELLEFYFSEVQNALVKKNSDTDFGKLELEWRELYSIAWADFSRFLHGWAPNHYKLNGYSEQMVQDVIMKID